MKGSGRHPFRVLWRLLWFAGEVIIALVDFLIHCAFRPQKSTLAARALWLQRASRRTLRIFKFTAQVAGPVPSGGLLVSNHLSYLDIPVLASLTPAVFVAKHEIKSLASHNPTSVGQSSSVVEVFRSAHPGSV